MEKAILEEKEKVILGREEKARAMPRAWATDRVKAAAPMTQISYPYLPRQETLWNSGKMSQKQRCR